MPAAVRPRHPVLRSALAVPLRVAALAAALATGEVLAAGQAEAVAKQTLIDALAPALALRGATALVTVSPPDLRRTLGPCKRIEGFLPPGSRLVGRTVVGVRCVDGAGWQAFLSASVRVEAPVWQSTRALRAGEPLAAGDLVLVTAPLAAADVDAAVAIVRSNGGTASASRGPVAIDGRQPAPLGRTVVRAVAAGGTLAAADVREEGRVNPGEPVRVIVVGNGFSITSEGRAVGAADPGGRVLIRLASGTLVNGTLRADRVVELPN